MIMVVSAAIVKDGRILLAQRSGTTSHAFKWCTPGGKVDPGESHFDALARELREEIGVVAHGPIRPVYECELPSTRPGQMVRVACYRVERIEGAGACLEGTIGLGWFSIAELAGLPLAPADDAQRAVLLRAMVTE